MLGYHILGFAIGSALDLLIGDPHWMPHPVVAIGRWIARLDQKLLGKSPDGLSVSSQRARGGALTALVIAPVAAVSAGAVALSYFIHPALGIGVESVLTCYCLAARSLQKETDHVVDELEEHGIEGGRKAVSMVVGRDTQDLDEEEVIKASVETVAENTADGVVAPLIYLALGGPVLGLVYKAVNTMDSMVGYRNDRYRHFGTAAARLDDAAGFVPARVTGLAICAAAHLLKGFDGREAWRIFRRDRYNHKSPNSAQSESAMAGALGLKLGGGAYYFGQWVEKPTMGDGERHAVREDVKKSQKLMYASAALTAGSALLIMGGIWLAGRKRK